MQNTTTTTGTMTDTTALNSLLRGEMSALETYRQAIEKFAGEPGLDQLHAFQRDHRDAADALWHHIERHGGQPSEGSGPWGTFAKAVTGAAKLLGDTAALKALKEGEEHGLKDYQDALDSGNLPADCRELILGFIPKQRQHIDAINEMMARV
jgi:uncharacterized protein (TIGR02284 family)